MQGQETAPRASCSEDKEKSIHLRWGTKGTTWHRMSSCEEGVHVEEQPREEAELWTESSSHQTRSVVAEGGCLSGCVGESRTRKCNRTSARSKGCAGRCGVTEPKKTENVWLPRWPTVRNNGQVHAEDFPRAGCHELS